MNVLMIWFGLHLFFLAVFNKNYEDSRKYELCIILTAVIIPFVVSIIPICHIHKVKTYGLAGAWCWIRSIDEECHEIKAGVIEQFTLWYAPVMLFALAFFLIIVVGNSSKKRGGQLMSSMCKISSRVRYRRYAHCFFIPSYLASSMV